MKVWKVPYPYDYHEMGEILVFDVETAAEATDKAKEVVHQENCYKENHDTHSGYQQEILIEEYLKLGEPTLLDISTPYFNEGCDC